MSSPIPASPAPAPDTVPKPKGGLAAFLDELRDHPIHPLVVHIPNGVLPLAILLAALGDLLGRGAFIAAGWFNLIFVAVMMPVVLAAGYLDWTRRYRGAMTRVFRRKIISGIIATIITWLIAPLPWAWPALADPAASARWLFPLLMAISMAPIVYASWLGAKLVFGGRKR